MTALPGLESTAAREWLRAARPDVGNGGSWHAEIISGGLSNLTYRITWAGESYILRRPPLGPVLPRAHDVAREYRIVAALRGTSVPVPEVIALCVDPSVIGAPFYVMRAVAGDVLRTADDTRRLTARDRGELANQLVDRLADLHAIDPAAVGLGDYGRYGGYAGRQIRTWGDQWRRSRTRDLPDMDRLLAALEEGLPTDDETTIVHGDYRLDNTIVTLAPRVRIEAVLDWELSTLGAPLADLGLMLTYWHDPGDDERGKISVAAGTTALDGFPAGQQLAERYAERTGRDLRDLPFYLALGAMKLGVILEGVHSRYLGGKAVGEGYDLVGGAVPVLAARGLRLLTSAIVPRASA
jgi:aminoglycoside phosphotransferase (APT) family kinase protein